MMWMKHDGAEEVETKICNKKEEEIHGKAFKEFLKKYKRQGNVSYKIFQRRKSSSKINCAGILIMQEGCRG